MEENKRQTHYFTSGHSLVLGGVDAPRKFDQRFNESLLTSLLHLPPI